MKSKLLFYFLPLFIILIFISGNDTYRKESITDPVNYESDTIPPPNFPFSTKWNWYHQNIPGVSLETVGAIKFQGKYIMNRWDNNILYRVNDDGPNGGPGTIADSNTNYAGQIRDMTIAPDGSGTEYLWGGRASTVLYKMDALGNTIATYTHSGAAYRAVAWDMNRKGFWSSNFTGNIVCRDTNGTVLRTITSTLSGKYGLGWDSTLSQDSAFLWVWSQQSPNNGLHKIHLASGNTVATYLFPLVGGTLGIAGGAEVQIIDNELLLFLNYQEFAVVAYKMKDIVLGLYNNVTVINSYLLQQNFPNPFNPVTKILYSIPVSGKVKLTIYDISGKEVSVPLNEHKSAGEHAIDFNADGLSSGVYFYKLEASDFNATKKMMIVR